MRSRHDEEAAALPIRFWIFLAILIVGTAALVTCGLGIPRAMLIGFDAGAVVFLGSTLWMMRQSDSGDIRQRAAENDGDHLLLFLFAGVVVLVVLVAVSVELVGSGSHKPATVALAAGTLLLAWLFSNILITMHYAHLYYISDDDNGGKDTGGLDFPDDAEPDYGDFAYFAFVLGMTFQVSDVQITAKPTRRLAMYHGLAAFLFNIVVVALSVSLIGDLLK